MPSKGLQRDVLAGAELTQQISYPSAGQAGGDLGEQVAGDQAHLPGDDVENGQAHHHVTIIDGPDSLADRIRQERIAKQRGRAAAQRYNRVAGSVPVKRDEVPVIQAAQEIGGNTITRQLKHRLGVSIPISGNPRQDRLHAPIIAVTGAARTDPARNPPHPGAGFTVRTCGTGPLCSPALVHTTARQNQRTTRSASRQPSQAPIV